MLSPAEPAKSANCGPQGNHSAGSTPREDLQASISGFCPQPRQEAGWSWPAPGPFSMDKTLFHVRKQLLFLHSEGSTVKESGQVPVGWCGIDPGCRHLWTGLWALGFLRTMEEALQSSLLISWEQDPVDATVHTRKLKLCVTRDLLNGIQSCSS